MNRQLTETVDQAPREYRSSHNRQRTDKLLTDGLGWFSIGLGLAELAAPGSIAEMVGMRDDGRTRNLLRFYGMRELAAGIGILSQRQPAGWMWGRVAGDVVDLTSLVSAMASSRTDKSRLVTAAAAVAGVTALDIYCAQELSREAGTRAERGRDNSVRVVKSIVVNRSPEDAYRFWRDLENLPTFMRHLESVQNLENNRSRWRAIGPAGTTFEWEAEIVDDHPNAFLAWRSLEESEIRNSGSVRFQTAPGGRGTIVRVELQYAPPGGKIGVNIAKLFGTEPGQQIEHELRAFKQILETGEIVQSDASIHRGMHPAQPSARTESERTR